MTQLGRNIQKRHLSLNSSSPLMAVELIGETAGKMTQLCRRTAKVNLRWRCVHRVCINFRDFFRFFWEHLVVCSVGRSPRYGRLHFHGGAARASSSLRVAEGSGLDLVQSAVADGVGLELSDSDLVSLKISLLGDRQIGKTTFVIKYVGDEQEKRSLQMSGLNLMDKTLTVQGATISFSIWDVGGDQKSSCDHFPIACKDSVAILYMFDLTSRCTLNSVIGWYNEARKWNKTAIPILIGTKFDDFVQLPPNLQYTIITQARAYAKAMKATLFFSSATHNINVNKIFKFIMAKLLNLPSTVKRNLTIGEPTIDF